MVPINYNNSKYFYFAKLTQMVSRSFYFPSNSNAIYFHIEFIVNKINQDYRLFRLSGSNIYLQVNQGSTFSWKYLRVYYHNGSAIEYKSFATFFEDSDDEISLDIILEFGDPGHIVAYKNNKLIEDVDAAGIAVPPSGSLQVNNLTFEGYCKNLYVSNINPNDSFIDDINTNGFSEHLLKKAVAAYSLDYNLSVNTIAILGHNINSGSNITIKANDTNSFTSPSYSSSLTWNRNTILSFLSSKYCYKYWQFSFTGLTQALEIGRLWLGDYIDINPLSLNDFTIDYNSVDLVQHNTYRQKFAEEITNYRTFDLSFPKTEESMIVQLKDLYDYSSKYKSIIFCNFDTIRNYELVEPCYCSINNNLQFSHINRMGFEYKLELEEEL
jgi:hypothetical protein